MKFGCEVVGEGLRTDADDNQATHDPNRAKYFCRQTLFADVNTQSNMHHQ